jgi:hypothetical protein
MTSHKYCLNGANLEGKSTAAVRCCADVESCAPPPTSAPTRSPTRRPSLEPTKGPTPRPTSEPSVVPSPAPTGANLTDCRGVSVYVDWRGDGFCDAGLFDYDVRPKRTHATPRSLEATVCHRWTRRFGRGRVFIFLFAP